MVSGLDERGWWRDCGSTKRYSVVLCVKSLWNDRSCSLSDRQPDALVAVGLGSAPELPKWPECMQTAALLDGVIVSPSRSSY